MEHKEDLDESEFPRELWQCPNCKNIEVFSQRIGQGYLEEIKEQEGEEW